MGLFLSLASLKIIDYTHFNGSVLLIVSPDSSWRVFWKNAWPFFFSFKKPNYPITTVQYKDSSFIFFLVFGSGKIFHLPPNFTYVFLVVLHGLLESYVQRNITKGYKKNMYLKKKA